MFAAGPIATKPASAIAPLDQLAPLPSSVRLAACVWHNHACFNPADMKPGPAVLTLRLERPGNSQMRVMLTQGSTALVASSWSPIARVCTVDEGRRMPDRPSRLMRSQPSPVADSCVLGSSSNVTRSTPSFNRDRRHWTRARASRRSRTVLENRRGLCSNESSCLRSSGQPRSELRSVCPHV